MRLLPVLFMLCTSLCKFETSMAQVSLSTDSGIISLNVRSFETMRLADVSALKNLLSNKRVVMLGEATHGDGNVQELKTMMVKFLHEQMGFNMLAFESGFYDVYKANKNINAGGSFKDAISNSIFPIWTNSRQCQELWQYLEKNRSSITLAGFDPQLSATYGRNMIADLEEFWERSNFKEEPDFDLLEAAVQHMADRFEFPERQDYSKFEKEINKIISVLSRSTNTDVAFWKQVMQSTLALAGDYYHNNPSAKTEETFKAFDSNPRDKQMALNLLYLLKQYPTAKFICWGATTHFMNNPRALQDDELSKYVPMGKLLKDALGDKVCIIGATAGRGSYGIFGNKVKQLEPVNNSLEEKLAGEGVTYSLVPLKNIKPQVFTTLAVEHKPLTGKWEDVLDAVLYVPELSPSVFYKEKTDAVVQQSSNTSQVQPIKKLTGKVINKTDRSPVPFASIRIGGITLVSNNTGVFEWPANVSADSIEISSIGFKNLSQAIPAAPRVDTTYFTLSENQSMLQAVVVRPLEKDPVTIMKKVIDHKSTNLPSQDFTISMYVHETLKEKKDTIRDVEYITDIYSQKGYSEDFSIKAGLAELKWNRKLQDSVMQKTGSILNAANTAYLKTYSRIDYLYNLPLFTDKKKLKYYKLTLDSIITFNDEQVFVISFDSKRKSERYTFAFDVARFYGTIYVNTSDYAVLKYNISLEGDTTSYNADARKYFTTARFGNNDRFFWSLLKSQDVMSRNTIYAKQEGVYVPVYVSLLHRQQGTAQLGKMPVSYSGSAEYYLYNFKWGSAVDPTHIETNLLRFNKPNDPAFWNNLIKPVSNAY